MLIKKLNVFLANHQVFFIKLHNLHWNVVGSSFFRLHAKFEELYDQAAVVIDDVAERILAIGGRPCGSLKGALSLATLSELEDKDISGNKSVEVLLADLKTITDDSREIRSLAAEQGDDFTADIFNAYVGEFEKVMWMLKACLKD